MAHWPLLCYLLGGRWGVLYFEARPRWICACGRGCGDLGTSQRGFPALYTRPFTLNLEFHFRRNKGELSQNVISDRPTGSGSMREFGRAKYGLSMKMVDSLA
jgi:hypothetical protein